MELALFSQVLFPPAGELLSSSRCMQSFNGSSVPWVSDGSIAIAEVAIFHDSAGVRGIRPILLI